MYVHEETKKAVVLSVLITLIVSIPTTLILHDRAGFLSYAKAVKRAVVADPMRDPANFAGVDTLGMRLETVAVDTPAFHTLPSDPGYCRYRVDYVGARGIHGHGEAGTLPKAAQAAAENYRQLQKERGK